MTYLTWIGLTVVVALGVFGVVHVAGAAGRNHPPSRVYQVPDAGWVLMPGRFVSDSGATRLVSMDVLMTYGKRRWNIGGYEVISEAIAVGSKSKFADREEFRMQAAHYLNDAEWRASSWTGRRQKTLGLPCTSLTSITILTEWSFWPNVKACRFMLLLL